jgi:pyruvate-formate lyase-activating enzyme
MSTGRRALQDLPTAARSRRPLPTRVHAFRIVLIKPSKYRRDGFVERFRRGFMPNSTLLHLKSLTPKFLGGRPVEVVTFDEHVETNLDYLKVLQPEHCDLLALVGVQSHQMHRALDLAALARSRGVRNCVLGGPHPMTCDTSEVEGRGVSFAQVEAELVWPAILADAFNGELQPIYSQDDRWQEKLEGPALEPPSRQQLRRFVVPMMGVYPARGCPYRCSFCSVIKIAGRQVRSQPIDTTLTTLRLAHDAGVRLVMFTSDNFNKYPEARQLLEAMIAERLTIPFFVQCDVQLGKDPEFVALLARAGCGQVFIGVESFSREALKAFRKPQNHPSRYADLVDLCHRAGISTHLSNIIGFPDQTRKSVLEHLEELQSLRAFMASFYVLTPIPGTQQYDEYLAAGAIREKNLDRFDATELVWDHPHLDAGEARSLLFRCYRTFYRAPGVLSSVFGRRWNAPWFALGLGLGSAVSARIAASQGRHPMAGGLWAVTRDNDAAYMKLRRRTFAIERLSLPKSRTTPRRQLRLRAVGES